MKNTTQLGHERKKKIKAMVFSVLMDHKNGKLKRRRVTRLNGRLQFYSSIDDGFIQRTIKTYERKFGIKLQEVLSVYGERN